MSERMPDIDHILAVASAIKHPHNAAMLNGSSVSAFAHDTSAVITALRAENERLREACKVLREASYQSHTGHWDPTQQSGVGCPQCIRARELRAKANAILNAAVSEQEATEPT